MTGATTVRPADARADDERRLLCALGDAIRDEVVRHRDEQGVDGLHEVVGQVEADVLYAVDLVSEDRVRAWLDEHWPTDRPVRLVMEGIDDHETVIAPGSADPTAAQSILVIDPIDGTRNLMYDKRPAWALTALAPASADASDRGRDGRPEGRLSDITVAAMTEIPTTKQWRADQLSAVRGAGADGVVAEGVDVRTGLRRSIGPLRPSTASGLEHGFTSFSHYLPDGKALLATIEQALFDRLVPPGPDARQVFEDQYLCSAGQLHEVMTGRDRIVGDLRPLALAHLGQTLALTGHPYDICTALILTELGGLFEDPWGGPVDAPLDTTTPVTWVAYANAALADLVRPPLMEVLDDQLGPRSP